MTADAPDGLAEVLVCVLVTHDRDNSTAGWNGSPNPHDWRNIRRACICGERLVDHDNPTPTEVSSAHRAHVADHLAQAVAADKADAVRAGRAEALREHRLEWAGWLERWDGAVSPQRPTIPGVIAWLRADFLPFGAARAEAEQGGGE